MSDPSARNIQLLQVLGRGGFGVVYLADIVSRSDFRQRVALKVLNRDASAIADVVARQRDEARLLAHLNHENIVKVLDLIDLDDKPAVLMEYVEGVDVQTLLHVAPAPARAALSITAFVSSALEAAYNQTSPWTGRPLQVIHRDIKPANILLTPSGGVKVLDFGVARAEFDREGTTQAVHFGTLRYMAPEHFAEVPLTAAVDIYALGLTLAEMLSGEATPRLGLARGRFEIQRGQVLEACLKGDWPGATRQDLIALMESMLAFEPGERPTAAQVHDRCLDLADAVSGPRLSQYAREAIPPLLLARQGAQATEALPDHSTFRLAGSAQDADVTRADAIGAPDPDVPSAPTLAGALIDEDPPLPDPLPQSPEPKAPPGPAWVDQDLPPKTPAPIPDPPTPRPSRAGLGLLAGVAGLLLALAAVALGWLLLRDPADPAPAVAAKGPEPAAAPDGPAPAPDPDPALAQAEGPPAEPAAPPVDTPPAPAPGKTTSNAKEEPEVAPAAPEVALTDPTRKLTFLSKPSGARIYLDDQLVGRTPLRNHLVPDGVHRVRVKNAEATQELEITVGPDGATRYRWEQEDDHWMLE